MSHPCSLKHLLLALAALSCSMGCGDDTVDTVDGSVNADAATVFDAATPSDAGVSAAHSDASTGIGDKTCPKLAPDTGSPCALATLYCTYDDDPCSPEPIESSCVNGEWQTLLSGCIEEDSGGPDAG